MLKGVIFDLDGTLLDSLGEVAYFANKTLDEFGFENRQKEEYRYLAGQGAFYLMKNASKTVDNELAMQMSEKFSSLYAQKGGESKVYEGVYALLDELEAMGIKKAVLSNKPHELTLSCVKEAFGSYRFESILGHRPFCELKPSPDSALEIASIFGLKAEDIALVGDTYNDVVAAKRGGFYSIGVSWGFRNVDELLECGADAIVYSPLQIVDFFKN